MARPSKKQVIYIPAGVEEFERLGAEIMRRDQGTQGLTQQRRWMSFFGVRPIVVADVWKRLKIPAVARDEELKGAEPKHLLWALMFLRMYGCESEMATLAGGRGNAVDEQTFRKWSKIFIVQISYLKDTVIRFEKRKEGDIGNDCLMSVDGTDFRIPFQVKCPKAFFTKKFWSSGLRYEVALCIQSGDIVWIMGPFPCGDWHDVEIFRYALKQLLEEGERVETDDGYVGEDPLLCKCPGSVIYNQDDRVLAQRSTARLRHETCNRRFKLFKCLFYQFKHDLSFHGPCFRAVATLTQLEFDNGAGLFDVEYNDAVAELVPDTWL